MKFLSIWTNFYIDSMFFFRKLHYLKLHYWAIAKMKICNRSPWKSYSKGIKKVIKYLRDENNSKQQQFLSKNLGTSLGSLIENLSLLCECPTSLISKHFLLSPFGSFHLPNFKDNPYFNIYWANGTFSFLKWSNAIHIITTNIFMAISAVTLILFHRRPKRLKPNTYEIVNYIYYFTVFTKYLSDQIE